MQVLYRNISQLVTCRGGVRRGGAMADAAVIEDGAFLVEDGRIVRVGTRRELEQGYRGEAYDCGGALITPGFADSHTHLVFAGERSEEFLWRLRGDSYLSIMERGGGIVNTVDATRAASGEELFSQAQKHLAKMLEMGVTCAEIKTGYGLDTQTELKQISVIQRLQESEKMQIVGTFMGAHALPRGADADEYIDECIRESLPAAAGTGVCEFADIFVEKGAFSAEQAERYLRKAKELGFALKVHADEMTPSGGTRLGVRLGAKSVDHLLKICDEDIALLGKSDTVATVLPLTAFCLGEEYAPARKLIDGGAIVAAASDFNPGSCCTYSIPLMIALMCIYMKMSVDEALCALTINGAAACGRDKVSGSIECGKRADFVLFDCKKRECLPYYSGINLVRSVFTEGEKVYG